MLADRSVVFLVATLGAPAVRTDGHVVFQPRKSQRSGICGSVEGRVLIYPHKGCTLEAVKRHCPASHDAMVDKPRQLAVMKSQLGQELTTVFVRQGHYASESAASATDPDPDLSFERIGDLLDCELSSFLDTNRGEA